MQLSLLQMTTTLPQLSLEDGSSMSKSWSLLDAAQCFTCPRWLDKPQSGLEDWVGLKAPEHHDSKCLCWWFILLTCVFFFSKWKDRRHQWLPEEQIANGKQYTGRECVYDVSPACEWQWPSWEHVHTTSFTPGIVLNSQPSPSSCGLLFWQLLAFTKKWLWFLHRCWNGENEIWSLLLETNYAELVQTRTV